MWNEPSPSQLSRLPRIGATDQVPWQDVVIHEHFFLSACDWFLAEYDPGDRLFYGYAILNDDLDNSEWGYVDFDELRAINIRGFQIDRDLHWLTRRAGEVDKIVAAYRHRGME